MGVSGTIRPTQKGGWTKPSLPPVQVAAALATVCLLMEATKPPVEARLHVGDEPKDLKGQISQRCLNPLFQRKHQHHQQGKIGIGVRFDAENATLSRKLMCQYLLFSTVLPPLVTTVRYEDKSIDTAEPDALSDFLLELRGEHQLYHAVIEGDVAYIVLGDLPATVV
jgi:hypothetical protein